MPTIKLTVNGKAVWSIASTARCWYRAHLIKVMAQRAVAPSG